MRAFYRLLTELTSRRTLSRLAGALAKSGFSRRLIPHFVKVYAIRADEAEKPIGEYASLNEFFTRRLKAGARTPDAGERTLISPVDAVVTAFGPVREGTRMTVKGQEYTVEELLNRSPRTVNYRQGAYIVLYLSPSDYHRIHAPVGGRIVETELIPGTVYPVNDFGLRHVRNVLSRNVRRVTYIRHAWGETAVVKIGALNVASIRYVDPLPEEVRKGEELATFEFGSTVVVLTESGTFRFRPGLNVGDRVRMGEPLGELHPRESPVADPSPNAEQGRSEPGDPDAGRRADRGAGQTDRGVEQANHGAGQADRGAGQTDHDAGRVDRDKNDDHKP
jgi:phosphatidylserine decarboxylase